MGVQRVAARQNRTADGQGTSGVERGLLFARLSDPARRRRREGFPGEDELVLCTVTKVLPHVVFVNIDEYDKGGLVHISEIAPGRIRNIREYVELGKKIVCKVLRVDEQKGHIDLSLRRVSEIERKKKLEEIKQEQKAEKIVEFACTNVKENTYDILQKIMPKVHEKYGTLHDFFQSVAEDKDSLDALKLSPKLAKELLSAIKQRIKPIEVEIKGKMKLVSFASDGISQIKEVFRKVFDGKQGIQVIYTGAGTYQVSVKSNDYKSAEAILTKAVDEATKYMEKHVGIAEFKRAEA